MIPTYFQILTSLDWLLYNKNMHKKDKPPKTNAENESSTEFKPVNAGSFPGELKKVAETLNSLSMYDTNSPEVLVRYLKVTLEEAKDLLGKYKDYRKNKSKKKVKKRRRKLKKNQI